MGVLFVFGLIFMVHFFLVNAEEKAEMEKQAAWDKQKRMREDWVKANPEAAKFWAMAETAEAAAAAEAKAEAAAEAKVDNIDYNLDAEAADNSLARSIMHLDELKAVAEAAAVAAANPLKWSTIYLDELKAVAEAAAAANSLAWPNSLKRPIIDLDELKVDAKAAAALKTKALEQEASTEFSKARAVAARKLADLANINPEAAWVRAWAEIFRKKADRAKYNIENARRLLAKLESNPDAERAWVINSYAQKPFFEEDYLKKYYALAEVDNHVYHLRVEAEVAEAKAEAAEVKALTLGKYADWAEAYPSEASKLKAKIKAEAADEAATKVKSDPKAKARVEAKAKAWAEIFNREAEGAIASPEAVWARDYPEASATKAWAAWAQSEFNPEIALAQLIKELIEVFKRLKEINPKIASDATRGEALIMYKIWADSYPEAARARVTLREEAELARVKGLGSKIIYDNFRHGRY